MGKNKKLYLVDENNIIVKEGKKGFINLYATVINSVILLVIYLIFHIIIEVFIGISVNISFFFIILTLIMLYAAIKIIINTKKYYGYAYNQYDEYVLTIDNKYIILKNMKKLNAHLAGISAMSLGSTLLNQSNIVNTLIGLGFYSDGLSVLEPTQEIIEHTEELLQMIEKGEFEDFKAQKYENVKFIKETKTKYYFVGDLVKENKTIKNKKFKIAKIYHNHEDLKVINHE